MTNTTKQTKNYEDMNNEGKAQVIYDTLLQKDPTTLSELLMELSPEYSEDEILTVEDWLDYFREENVNIAVLVKVAQKSKDLNIDDEYIRESIYYDGYKTSNNIIDLLDKDEAIEWITSALEDNSSYIEDFNTAWLYQD